MPEQTIRADINPQLCKTLNPAKHTWDHDWIAEPKFDGLRCIVVAEIINGVRHVRAYSRNGKPLYNMDHILNDIGGCQNGLSEFVLDGEVYTKDWNLSMGIVKSSVTAHPDAHKLRYHVWDCLTIEEFQSTWKDARKVVHKIHSTVSNQARKDRLLALLESCEYVKIVEGKLVGSDEELQNTYTDFLTEGYEGAILKDPTGPYEGGRRSPYWLKIKPWSDADLTVVGAVEGNGKHVGRLGKVLLEGEAEWNGETYSIKTECGTGFDDPERELYWKMWNAGTLTGLIMEIKFQDVTVDGACRFPVFNRLREDK